jgi:hypothetical protein
MYYKLFAAIAALFLLLIVLAATLQIEFLRDLFILAFAISMLLMLMFIIMAQILRSRRAKLLNRQLNKKYFLKANR